MRHTVTWEAVMPAIKDLLRALFVGVVGLWILGGASPPTANAQCCGDCNGNGKVAIDELLTAVNHALSECPDMGDFERAFLESQEVQSRISELFGNPAYSFTPGPIEVTGQVGGGCGVAGCSVSVLVLQTFRTTMEPNPQTGSVIALVTRHPAPEGTAPEVQLVNIRPSTECTCGVIFEPCPPSLCPLDSP